MSECLVRKGQKITNLTENKNRNNNNNKKIFSNHLNKFENYLIINFIIFQTVLSYLIELANK